MKLLVVFACLVAVVYAQNDVPIIRNSVDVQGDGYAYSYELGNGISAQESGSLKDPETISAQGSYKFTAPDGQTFETQYTADENGFRPSGAHIPDTPELIQRSLSYLATAPPS